jgi:hypothetical protein
MDISSLRARLEQVVEQHNNLLQHENELQQKMVAMREQRQILSGKAQMLQELMAEALAAEQEQASQNGHEEEAEAVPIPMPVAANDDDEAEPPEG